MKFLSALQMYAAKDKKLTSIESEFSHKFNGRFSANLSKTNLQCKKIVSIYIFFVLDNNVFYFAFSFVIPHQEGD